MLNQFQYAPVDEYPGEVRLHLYKTINGTSRATVKGPRGTGTMEIAACKTLPEGFAIAIRMANRADVSVVVTGDATLWDGTWGDLVWVLA